MHLKALHRLVPYLHRLTASLNPRRTLRARLGWVIFATAIALALLTSYVINHTASRQLEASVGAALEQLAYQVSDKLDRGIFERYREIQVLTTLDVIRNPTVESAQKRSLLEELQRSYPLYSWIGLTDSEGNVVVSTGGLLENKNVAQRPWFQNAKTQPAVGDVHEALLLAQLLPNPTAEPLRFIDVSAPVFTADRQFLGVLGAHLSWNWAQEVRDSLLHPLGQHTQIDAFIFDAGGKLLLGTDDAQSFLAQAQNRISRIQQASNGKAYLTGIVRSKGYLNYAGLGWTVVARQPIEAAFAGIRELQRQVLLLNVGLGGLAAIAGWSIAHYLTRSLLKITIASDQVRQGQSLHLPVIPGDDEIARLSRSLDYLLQTLIEDEAALQMELTERKRAEAALRQLNATLEQRVVARTTQLTEINQELESFTYSVSHDLRAPLRVMHGFSQALAEDYGEQLDDIAHSYLQSISEHALHLGELINDLLAYSRLSRTEIQLQSTSLNHVLEIALQHLKPEIQERHASILIPCELPDAIAHRSTLVQVITNLLSNALKFVEPEVQPKVTVTAELEPGWVKVWIADNGIGIAPEHQTRIFKVFERLHGIENYPGTGIGLAIVRKGLDRIGGRFGVQSKPGVGSRFWIALPTVSSEGGYGDAIPTHSVD